MVNAKEFYDELKKVDSRDKIFSVSFYGTNGRESLYSTLNIKEASMFYAKNYENVKYFVIDFRDNPYGGCNFVTLKNFNELVMYNKNNEKRNLRLTEGVLVNIVKECVSRILKEERRNVVRIRITWLADMGRSKENIMDTLLKLRHARNVGDEENVNHYVLGALRNYPNFIQFEIVS